MKSKLINLNRFKMHKSIFKVLLTGLNSSGKTSYIKRLEYGKMLLEINPTIGIKTEKLVFSSNNKSYDLEICECPENHINTQIENIKYWDIIVFMIDINTINSLEDAEYLREKYQRLFDTKIPKIIFLSKIDVYQKLMITQRSNYLSQYFSHNNTMIRQISTLLNFNIHDSIKMVIQSASTGSTNVCPKLFQTIKFENRGEVEEPRLKNLELESKLEMLENENKKLREQHELDVSIMKIFVNKIQTQC